MPTFSSIEAFQRELTRLDRTIERDMVKATKEMAQRAEQIAVREAISDLGGDSRFSGWKNRDLADLRVKRSRQGTGHFLLPTRKSGGPWKVAEQGRNQGDVRGRGGAAIFIGPSIDRQTGETFRTKTGKVRMTRTRRSGRWNGYTRGKSTASDAVARFEPEAEKIGEKAMRTAIVKHFDST